MKPHPTLLFACVCVAYMDEGKGREHMYRTYGIRTTQERLSRMRKLLFAEKDFDIKKHAGYQNSLDIHPLLRHNQYPVLDPVSQTPEFSSAPPCPVLFLNDHFLYR